MVLKAPNDYAKACFKQYGLKTDDSGVYAAMYKPYHLIGLELGISVLSAACVMSLPVRPAASAAMSRPSPSGHSKREKYSMARAAIPSGASSFPPNQSLKMGILPIGLAHKVKLRNDVTAGQAVTWSDIEIPNDSEAVRVRQGLYGTEVSANSMTSPS